MPTLSSLLLHREVTTLREMDVALARQLSHGGDLVTNLLEVAPIDEHALIQVMAEAAGLAALPDGPVREPEAAALQLMPTDLAKRLEIMPISVNEDIFVLAVAEPLAPSAEEELTFALARAIEQVITTPLRIREAHANWYGLALDRRHLRLLARLEGRPDPSPSSLPPRPVSGDSVLPPRLPGRSSAPEVAMDAVSVAPIISVDTDTQAVAQTYGRDREPVTQRESPPRQRAVVEVPAAPLLPAELLDGGVAPPASERPLMLPSQAPAKRKQGTGRRRGPFTAAMAQEVLSEAETHGVMLRVLFDFARQYFEYTALFVLHGDLAEGVDASGPGAGASRIRGIGVPIEIPSILSTARDRRAALLARPSEEGIDAFLRQDLQRPMTTQVLVVPVVVRNRVVALLYGDDGEAAVSMNEVGDVLALASLVGKALESHLLERKRARETPIKGGVQGTSKRRDTYRAMKPQRQEPSDPPPNTQRQPATSPPHASINPFPVAAPFPAQESSTMPGMQSRTRHITATYLTPVKVPEANGSEDQLASRLEPQRVPTQPNLLAQGSMDSSISPAAKSVPGAVVRSPRSRPTPLGYPAVSPMGSGIDSVRVARVISVGPATPSAAYVRSPSAPPPSPAPASVRRTATTQAPGRGPSDSQSTAGLGQPATFVADQLPPSTREPTAPPASWRGLQQSPAAGSVPPRLELAMDPAPRLELVHEADELMEEEGEAPDVLIGESDENDEMLETVLAELERSSPLVGTVAGDEVLLRETAVARTFVEEGPRQPPKSQPPGDRNLPLVIVDLEGEAEELLTRLIHATDGRAASEARAELIRMGAAAARTVAQRFPGPVHQTIDEDLPEVPAASECGPVLDVAVALGQASVLGHAMVQELVRLTESQDVHTRVWAMLALADIGTDRAVDAVLQGLMDDDRRVCRGARWAAIALSGGHAAGRAMREATEQLVAGTVLSVSTRLLAIETLGDMRDPCSVPVLIQALGEPDNTVSEASLRALRNVTRTEVQGGVQTWTTWWSQNQTRPRIEWLIDALTSPTTDLREAAARELAERTGRDFGYRADMPLEARASVQARYRALRAQEGHEHRDG